MKIYTTQNNSEVIEYLQKRDNLNMHQKKQVLKVFNYCYKNDRKYTFIEYMVEGVTILINTFIYDFIDLYDVTIKELINNNILVEK